MAEENIAELYVELGVVQEVDNVQEIGTVQEHELDKADNLQEIGIGQELDNVDDVQEIGIAQELDNADVPEDSHPAEDENAYAPGEEREAELHSSEVELDKSAAVEEKKWPGWPGENVFRILIPVQKVGGIIGRKGEFIKKMCEETRARIKILDGPPGITERAVLISAKEDPNLTIPPALDGLLTIHKRIIDPDSDPSNPQSGGTVCTKLLVAASQAGSLIGKQGGTVKTIQDDSHCTIRVLGGENLPVFALPDDSIVEVQGEPAGVIKAVELIASHLRKFLVDRSVVAVFEMQMQMANARGNQDSPRQSWGPPPPFPMNPAGHGYESNRPFMPHSQRPYDNYYPPGDMPMEKPPRSGPPTYGRGMSGGAHTTNVQPQQAVIAKVTQNMQIPLSYADAVIGLNGANISYIRRASGATIAIQETRGVPDEMTVEIDGSASEVQTAQQLIQNSIAEAVNSQNPSSGPPSQGYNPYPSQGTGYASHGTGYASQPSHGTGYASQPSHGAGYTSQPSNAAGQGAHAPPPGDYGSMYGGNYGY